jgi:hypothetical protein
VLVMVRAIIIALFHHTLVRVVGDLLAPLAPLAPIVVQTISPAIAEEVILVEGIVAAILVAEELLVIAAVVAMVVVVAVINFN